MLHHNKNFHEQNFIQISEMNNIIQETIQQLQERISKMKESEINEFLYKRNIEKEFWKLKVNQIKDNLQNYIENYFTEILNKFEEQYKKFTAIDQYQHIQLQLNAILTTLNQFEHNLNNNETNIPLIRSFLSNNFTQQVRNISSYYEEVEQQFYKNQLSFMDYQIQINEYEFLKIKETLSKYISLNLQQNNSEFEPQGNKSKNKTPNKQKSIQQKSQSPSLNLLKPLNNNTSLIVNENKSALKPPIKKLTDPIKRPIIPQNRLSYDQNSGNKRYKQRQSSQAFKTPVKPFIDEEDLECENLLNLLQQLFAKLDDDGDDLISPNKIELNNLDLNYIQILKEPLLFIDSQNKEINFEGFCQIVLNHKDTVKKLSTIKAHQSSSQKQRFKDQNAQNINRFSFGEFHQKKKQNEQKDDSLPQYYQKIIQSYNNEHFQ